jgi:predicted transcriptional regulator
MQHALRAEAFRLIRDKGPLSTKEIALELEVDVSELSYHVRKLNEFDCIEKVGNRQVRGAVETFYIATEQHMIDTEEWDELVADEPWMAEVLTDSFMQGIVDDYTESRRGGVVGSDKEFFIVRTPHLFDPEGVQEALDASQRYEDEMTAIASRSAARRANEETDDVPVSTSIVFFKMQKPSKRSAH